MGKEGRSRRIQSNKSLGLRGNRDGVVLESDRAASAVIDLLRKAVAELDWILQTTRRIAARVFDEEAAEATSTGSIRMPPKLAAFATWLVATAKYQYREPCYD
jgi:hypothetical protein